VWRYIVHQNPDGRFDSSSTILNSLSFHLILFQFFLRRPWLVVLQHFGFAADVLLRSAFEKQVIYSQIIRITAKLIRQNWWPKLSCN
jgi:hypothetical protein